MTLDRGPVAVTVEGQIIAVMVKPQAYNDLLQQLDDTLDSLSALEARLSPGERIAFNEYCELRERRGRG